MGATRTWAWSNNFRAHWSYDYGTSIPLGLKLVSISCIKVGWLHCGGTPYEPRTPSKLFGNLDSLYLRTRRHNKSILEDQLPHHKPTWQPNDLYLRGKKNTMFTSDTLCPLRVRKDPFRVYPRLQFTALMASHWPVNQSPTSSLNVIVLISRQAHTHNKRGNTSGMWCNHDESYVDPKSLVLKAPSKKSYGLLYLFLATSNRA